MKKLYFLTLFMAVTCWVSAQTFITEDFSSGVVPPPGWTIDAQAANWSASASINALGEAPEAMFAWEPEFNATSRLISPAIDLTGHSSVVLMFKHFLDDYDGSGGYTIGAATRSGGSGWTSVWSVSPTANVGPEEKILNITNADVGASDFQFCIYFTGNSYNLDYWYIDDITLFAPYDLDGAMAQITTPKYVSGAVPVEGIVKNLGNNTITSIEISWKVSEDAIYSTTFNGIAIAFSETFSFSCEDLFYFPIGSYNLDVWVSAVNGQPDDDSGNNLNSKAISVVSHTVYRKPAFEEFTSSTCGPCAQFNTSFNPWCESHADQITLVKYQMDWPGNGDPYYTEEGGQRRMYYGVSYVPWPQCNGAYVDYNIGAVQTAFDNAILQPGIAKIASSHTLDGTTITVNANILPFADFSNFRAHIIVIENTTTQNTGGNGETAFHHVMMKMMPGADGTEMNILDREPVTLTETFDLAGTNIEEFDDLSVVVLFQEFTSKEIFQSEYSVENGQFANESSVTEITYDGNPVPGFDPAVFDYEIELPAGTTEIPMVAATATDPNGTLIVEPTWSLPGTTIVDCFGEDLISHKRYNIHFSVEVGIDEPGKESMISLYPNPAHNTLFVKGAKGADIRLYNITGQLVLSINDFTENSIDISAFDNGVYTLQVVREDNSLYNNKFTIVR